MRKLQCPECDYINQDIKCQGCNLNLTRLLKKEAERLDRVRAEAKMIVDASKNMWGTLGEVYEELKKREN